MDPTTTPALPDPAVDLGAATEIARDLVVIENRDVDLVPNIGIIGGTDAVLVVDTGMGPENADRVRGFAEEYARGRRLFVTTTHFHPEHAFGAQSFAGAATWIVDRAQAADLAGRGEAYLQMFRGMGGAVADRLTDVMLGRPDIVYDTTCTLDLGGRTVDLRAAGQAHTRGDQLITVPDVDVLFTGDLVETGQFAIFPWFPPYDVDVSGLGWIEVVNRLVASRPRTVVPGHGAVGGPERLDVVLAYLLRLRDETWRRRDSTEDVEAIAAEVAAAFVADHPQWRGREWIAPGVRCLCSEHPHTATGSADA